MSDLMCDGLGACLGHCPEGAISQEECEAEPYDERKVMENIVKQGEILRENCVEEIADLRSMIADLYTQSYVRDALRAADL